ncbi:hypothetical protein FQN51_002276, partial [Onygenales sp. PD_10]
MKYEELSDSESGRSPECLARVLAESGPCAAIAEEGMPNIKTGLKQVQRVSSAGKLGASIDASLTPRHKKPRLGSHHFIPSSLPPSHNSAIMATSNILRRALLYVPGSSQRMIDKSRTLVADCIAYDLEDSVTPAKKAEARAMVRNAIDQPLPPGIKERAVRINSVGSGLALADLTEV